jgi:hypothetical protein
MGAAFPSMLERLLSVLDAAVRADTVEAGRQALDEAFALLGALYAALDPARHPELSAYLTSAYDGCLRHIGEARPGRCEGLAVVITLLRHIRDAAASARAGVTDRPSFVGRMLAV